MWIGIAAREQSGSACKIAGMCKVSTQWTDEASSKRDQGSITSRIAGDELCRQARSLGETCDDDAFRRNPGLFGKLHQSPHRIQRGGQVRLILLSSREERMWVPTVPCCLRSKVRETLTTQNSP